MDEEFGDGEAVGEDAETLGRQVMHHLEGGGAAIDDDRLAIAAHLRGRPANCALLRDIDRFVDREGPTHQPALRRRVDRLGPAAHPAQPPLLVERRNVAANGGFR
ncbi:hypothetical protein D9M68_954810 [compost metagenome]